MARLVRRPVRHVTYAGTPQTYRRRVRTASPFALFCARARREALAGDFFAFPLAGATSAAGCASSEDRRAIAFHIRARAS
jgi:hypothetical protein